MASQPDQIGWNCQVCSEMALRTRLRQRARRLKTDTLALYLAGRDPRTPWIARMLVVLVVAYALSPIDLIPDFVPVLGYLDDLILVPLGIALALRLVPRGVMAECRALAQEQMQSGKPVSRAAGAVIAAIWVIVAVCCIVLGYRAFRTP
jgi:uncharacterized membrane protein YkvA (DUF1232 family)